MAVGFCLAFGDPRGWVCESVIERCMASSSGADGFGKSMRVRASLPFEVGVRKRCMNLRAAYCV